MSKPRFSTDKEVEHLHPIEDQSRTDYFHKSESGFILRVSKNSKSWLVSHTVKSNGKSQRRKVTIGQYPDISLKKALEQAQKIKIDARMEGSDIVGVRTDRKVAATIAEIMDHYFSEIEQAEKAYLKSRDISSNDWVPKKSFLENKRISAKDIIPTLGNLKAIELTRNDIKSFHKSIVNRGAPVAANRTIALLSSAFNCACEEELIVCAPFPKLKKIKAKETAREHILKDAEIKTIWNALDNESDNMRDIMRLLLLLGQRSMETMSMAIIDIDVDRKVWTVPAARTKNGEPNVLPLPATAWKIIKLRLNNDKWIFPTKYNTTREGSKNDGHTKSTKDTRRRLKKATGITGWTSHDCRRTCRTIMAREGILPFVAEMVLGHVQTGIEAVYDQHGYAGEKLKALEKVDRAILKILGIENKEDNIFQIQRVG